MFCTGSVQTEKVNIVGENDAICTMGERNLRLVGLAVQVCVRRGRHIDSARAKRDGNAAVDIFIKMASNCHLRSAAFVPADLGRLAALLLQQIHRPAESHQE